jgi:hypothetical protein
MPSRDFDMKKFINDAFIVVETTALAWTRDDEGKEKKGFFYKEMTLFFLSDEIVTYFVSIINFKLI